MTTGDIIQLVSAGAAIIASIVALFIASADRKTQLRIAREERAQDRLALELEYAVRLSTNRNMGGSSDPAESKRLGAEAMALAGVVGQRWVPMQFDRIMDGKTPEELANMLDDDDTVTPQWMKWRTEAALAVQSIVDEIYRETTKTPPKP